MTEKKPLIILTGPTAVGKTSLSIKLAQKTGGEIISADSMQVYRHMDIGSAKIKPEQMQGIPHHLIDVLDPVESFDVVTFQKLCKKALQGIYERGHIPILTGGTGFYIQAVLYDIDFTESQEFTEYRTKLETLAREEGAEVLHEMLQKVDEVSAKTIHANNVKRVIRALEFYHQTGKRISMHNQEQRSREAAYTSCYFVLTDERERIYDRINKRVDQMLEAGLIEEVQMLKQMGLTREQVSMQGLGYKEILSYLDGEMSLEEAVSILKRDTRHFAKRQLTWFRREKEVLWIDKRQFEYQEEKMLEYMTEQMQKAGICLKGAYSIWQGRQS